MNHKIKDLPRRRHSSSIVIGESQQTRMIRWIALLLASLSQSSADISSNNAAFFLDFNVSANGIRPLDGALMNSNSQPFWGALPIGNPSNTDDAALLSEAFERTLSKAPENCLKTVLHFFLVLPS